MGKETFPGMELSFGVTVVGFITNLFQVKNLLNLIVQVYLLDWLHSGIVAVPSYSFRVGWCLPFIRSHSFDLHVLG